MQNKLIVGLGNPGPEYHGQRHNIGMMVLEGFSLPWKNKFNGRYASTLWQNVKVHLLLPQTFMNLSGQAVAPAMQFFQLRPEDLIVVHDDLDFPFGALAFKKGGSPAGHNGLKSIIEHLGSSDFYRVRLGIGRPTGPRSLGEDAMARWVLSRFAPDEDLPPLLEDARAAVQCLVQEGMAIASNKFARRKV
jgi:PTH1 family peptidyl-tRNA hydrolase